MSRLYDALHSGRVLLMDGAMGTELLRRGVSQSECFELLNLTHPERIRAIHQAYLDAGAEVLLTHTFQSNPGALKKHGLESRLQEINRAALANARSVAGAGAFVAMDVGPFGARGYPREVLEQLIQSLCGADALLFETCSDHWDFSLFRACKLKGLHLADEPYLSSFTFLRNANGELRTRDRISPNGCARIASRRGVHALGVNCGRDIGLPELLEILQRYRSVTDLPLFVRPNAGTPKQVDGQWVYAETPESMAAWLPPLFEAGVRMVGGCCGTTPAHTAAFRKVVDDWNRAHFPDFSSKSPPTSSE